MADAPPKKKLPFKQRKKPTAPAPTPSDGNDKAEDELDLFSRRREMQPILEADRKRRLAREKRKTEAQAQEQDEVKKETEDRDRRFSEKRPLEVDDDDDEYHDARERLSWAGADDEDVGTMVQSMTVKSESFSKPVTPPASKRTRTESGSANSSRHRTTPSASKNREGSPSSRRESRLGSKTSTPSKIFTRSGRNRPPPTQPVISLDSEDDEADVKAKIKPDAVDIIDDSPVEDDIEEEGEFAEYIRKAEEERKKLAASAGNSTVRVMLTSEIEGTEVIRANMRLDKPLVVLRDAWVTNQLNVRGAHLPCPAADLILSWQRQKVYSYSNLYSLGVRVHGDSITGVEWKGLSEDRRNIHMEISTPEIWQRWEAEKDRQRRKDEARNLSDEDDIQVVEEDVKLKVILKPRDLEQMRVTVRPATTANTLIKGFKRFHAQKGNRIDDSKNVTLWFDGDQLANDSTLEDADIDDMDTIDVHID